MSGELLPSAERPVGLRLSAAISECNAFLMDATEKDIRTHGKDMMARLDMLWIEDGMMGRQCLVSGHGMWGERVTYDNDRQPVDHLREVRNGMLLRPYVGGTIGKPQALFLRWGAFTMRNIESQGFIITDPLALGQKDFKLWQQFLIDRDTSMPHPVYPNVPKILLFAKPDETLSVLPMEDMDEIYAQPSPTTYEIVGRQQQIDVLESYSSMLLATMYDPMFRNYLTGKEQIEEIESVLTKAEQATAILDSHLTVDPRYAYTLRLHENRLQYLPVLLNGTAVSGKCAGLTVLGMESLLTQPLRTTKDLYRFEDGISLVIELDEQPGLEEFDLSAKQLLYVPISDQEFTTQVELGQDIKRKLAEHYAVETEAQQANRELGGS